MSTAYTVDYFIEKFEKIPDEKWLIGEFGDGAGSHCALGHCGMGKDWAYTNESRALVGVFHSCPYDVEDVNDGIPVEYGHTPKERILNALREIKSKEESK